MRTSYSAKAVRRYDHLNGKKKMPSAATWIRPNGTREIRWRRAPLGRGIDNGLATDAMQLSSCAETPRDCGSCAQESSELSAKNYSFSLRGVDVGVNFTKVQV